MKYDLGKANKLGNRHSNQDRFAIIERPNAVLMVLADGMGGYPGGNNAADALVYTITNMFAKMKLPISAPELFFVEAFKKAHQTVYQLSNETQSKHKARSTVVASIIQDGAVWSAHLGDSRFYLYRNAKVIKRTTDHSVVEKLLKQGKITAKQKSSHPQRNQVTRCVGGHEKPSVASLCRKTPLDPGDIVLLCSDGLWNSLDDEHIGLFLFDEKNLTRSVDQMCQKAEADGYPKADNISAVAMRWISNESSTELPDIPVQNENEENDDKNSIDPEREKLNQTLDEIEQALKRAEENMKNLSS